MSAPGPMPGPYRVRPARPTDRAFMLELCHRLGEGFPLPAWRRPDEVARSEQAALAAFFAGEADGAAALVAEDAAGTPLGFVYLVVLTDYFRQEPHAHVSILAVHEAAEGRGVGRALLEASDAWARERGYRAITLNVFEANRRARELYGRMGYAPETLRYYKPL
ncbi:MAG TPA: GNAT family N-acetyltransferase [Gemmatimonadales bacterium]|nr:GNAT family N-acetyltransferase [Gemmatimonadales bacterium]